MQIKDENEETNSPSDDNGIPIYSSLESLLFIPKSMTKELSEKALKTQELLDKWSNNRRRMVRQMEAIAEKLNNWEKGCAISTTVGSSVGVVSGVAVIGGLIMMPPVAIAGLIVGTAAGISNLATGFTMMTVSKNHHKDVMNMMEEDKKLFEELLKSREELMETIKKIVEDEEFYKHFKNDGDIENKLKTVLGGSVTGITGLGARFAIASMGRLSSSLVKGVLHSVAVIGIVLDSVTLALSVKSLDSGAQSELGSEIVDASSKLEMMRQKVVRHFLNEDIWNAEEDQLSDAGSIEFVNPESPIHRSMTATSSEQPN
uniref:Apolipoprotein L3-like n=1 Tax=Caenorhabditis tropicalis TaxID=1561998 RepID=A0A1I7TST2_9PELO